jgi:hypothetical protein
MKRYPDWPRRLDAHFTAALKQPFQWGVRDCALGACAAVAAITGVNPGADLQGAYATEDEAAALMALSAGLTLSLPGPQQLAVGNWNLGDLVAAIAENYGMAEVLPTFAQRGDLVLVDNTPAASRQLPAASNPSLALGTVDLTGRYAWCAAEPGFVRVPLKRWRRAWRVG